jgi:E3 ubiquitin-protein ligase synoviolin
MYLDHFWEHGATVKVLFLTEYSIMAILSLSTWVRLTLHAVNLYKQAQNRQHQQPVEGDDDIEIPGWEGHERALFYLDIASDLVQSIIYILFFIVIMAKYGLPIHLLRDIYLAIHSVIKRFNDLLHYRRLVTNLDQRFLEATANDLAGNEICVVCRNEMRHGQGSVKRLPCGHMFHAHCLRGWLERGQSCPTCIAPVDHEEYERYLRDRGETRPQRQPQPDNTPNPEQNVQQVQIEQLQQALQQQYNQILESLQNTPLTTQELNQPTPFDQALLNQSLLQQQLQMPATNPINQFHGMMMDVVPENGFGDRGADGIMKDMYIKYLEHLRGLIDETLVKLSQADD